eukprot:TRINITY_DN9774_c0_g1_i1.p1 TRINITY_DN9774_c0_g1~~TRINITY_DN9774_c0_g1_i1.p1  ORF type:complete len:172 (+),score=53.56 TRINITY_DN9774_c0_g1_i1:69-584(+)
MDFVDFNLLVLQQSLAKAKSQSPEYLQKSGVWSDIDRALVQLIDSVKDAVECGGSQSDTQQLEEKIREQEEVIERMHATCESLAREVEASQIRHAQEIIRLTALVDDNTESTQNINAIEQDSKSTEPNRKDAHEDEEKEDFFHVESEIVVQSLRADESDAESCEGVENLVD